MLPRWRSRSVRSRTASQNTARTQVNGHLPLITVRPLKRPEFSYTRGVSFEDWVRANEVELRAWYQLTSEWDPELHPADWHDFVAVQFDLSQELDARLT